jgi:hypothetical protein
MFPERDTYDWISNGVFLRNRAALTAQNFHFSPVFPHGVTITKLTLYGYRDDALSSMQLFLYRINRVAGPTEMASITSNWSDLEPNNNVYDCWLVCAKIEFTG